jgi:beta-lactamase regulating signal transducer with metallopeptidase domain
MDLQKVFLTIWNMSLTGSIIIGFVLLARLLLRKAPKAFSYALWSVVLFRLLCPVSISSVFSVLNFTKAAEPVTQSVVTTMDYSAVEMPEFIPVPENEPEIEEPVIVTPEYQEPQIEDSVIPDDGMDFVEVPDAEFPHAPAEPVHEPIYYAVIIWLIGLGVMLVYNVISCIRLFRQIQEAIKEGIVKLPLLKFDLAPGKFRDTNGIKAVRNKSVKISVDLLARPGLRVICCT